MGFIIVNLILTSDAPRVVIMLTHLPFISVIVAYGKLGKCRCRVQYGKMFERNMKGESSEEGQKKLIE